MTWLHFFKPMIALQERLKYYLVPIMGARHVLCLKLLVSPYMFQPFLRDINGRQKSVVEAKALFLLPCVASNMVDLYPEDCLAALATRKLIYAECKAPFPKRTSFGCSRQQRLIFRVVFHVSTGGSNASIQPKRACVKVGTQYCIYISWCLGISSGVLFGPLYFGFCLGFSGCFGPRRANWWCRGSCGGRPHSPWMAGHGTWEIECSSEI